MSNEQPTGGAIDQLRLRAAGSTTRRWLGAKAFEWSVHLSSSDRADGAAVALGFTAQLQTDSGVHDVGPLSVSPVVQLRRIEAGGTLAVMTVTVVLNDEQIQRVEADRNGGRIVTILQPWLHWSSVPARGALDAVRFGDDQSDGAWWRGALDSWDWGRSIVIVVPRPIGAPNDPLDSAYQHLVAAQRQLKIGHFRESVQAVRLVFEQLRSVQRPGSASGKGRTVGERLYDVSAAFGKATQEAFDAASAASHSEPHLDSHRWTRDEAEALIAVAASMLRVVS